MKRNLMIIALALGILLPAKAQIVQTMNLRNGSRLHGYMKSQKPGNSCVFYAEIAEVVMDGQKAKSVVGEKVSYNNLSDEWKAYADENGLLDKKKELTLSSIDTGAMIENVLVLEQGRFVKYVELKHDYTLRWNKIGTMEYLKRDEMLLSGVNHTFKIKSGDMVRTVTGQCIKKIPGALTFLLKEDGVVESIETKDIVKDNLVPNNPDQTIFEQSILLDEVRMKNGEIHQGIIMENNYEENPNCLLLVKRDGEVETPVMLRMSEVIEYRSIPNPDYVEVRDILLNPGQILVNGNEAELVNLTEQSNGNGFVVAPAAKRVTLKHEGHNNFEVCIQANFKDEKEAKDNYFTKTRTYENDKKRAGWYYFKYKDLFDSSIQPNESGTSMNNTTKATFTVNSKGVYVFYNSNTKKAVVIVVE